MAITPETPERARPSVGRRLLWFVGMWGVSVLLVWLLSLVIRWAIVP